MRQGRQVVNGRDEGVSPRRRADRQGRDQDVRPPAGDPPRQRRLEPERSRRGGGPSWRLKAPEPLTDAGRGRGAKRPTAASPDAPRGPGRWRRCRSRCPSARGRSARASMAIRTRRSLQSSDRRQQVEPEAVPAADRRAFGRRSGFDCRALTARMRGSADAMTMRPDSLSLEAVLDEPVRFDGELPVPVSAIDREPLLSISPLRDLGRGPAHRRGIRARRRARLRRASSSAAAAWPAIRSRRTRASRSSSTRATAAQPAGASSSRPATSTSTSTTTRSFRSSPIAEERVQMAAPDEAALQARLPGPVPDVRQGPEPRRVRLRARNRSIPAGRPFEGPQGESVGARCPIPRDATARPAATSAARTTRSRRRRCPSARTATSPSSRTACARAAGTTRASRRSTLVRRAVADVGSRSAIIPRTRVPIKRRGLTCGSRSMRWGATTRRASTSTAPSPPPASSGSPRSSSAGRPSSSRCSTTRATRGTDIEIVDASEVVTMDDPATAAIRKKRNSSIRDRGQLRARRPGRRGSSRRATPAPPWSRPRWSSARSRASTGRRSRRCSRT